MGTQLSFADIAPTYDVTFEDAVTGNNVGNDGKPYWWLTPNADSYSHDIYERPTSQTYRTIAGRVATREYYENLDIVQVKAGFDADYLYIAMEMFGRNRIDGSGPDRQGLDYFYQVRLGKNPTQPYSAGGILLVSEQPSSKSNSTVFSGEKAFGYLDTNNDVGGSSVDIPNEGGGSGYDEQIISDGKDKTDKKEPFVLLTRIAPDNPNTVEFAFDYKAFGYSEDDLLNLQYLVFSADKGIGGTSSFLWNDKWNDDQGGSPYVPATLENIYELDSLTAGGGIPNVTIPEPMTLLVLLAGAPIVTKKVKSRIFRT